MAAEGYFAPGDPGSEEAQTIRARQAKDARSSKGGFRAFVESMLPVPSRAPESVAVEAAHTVAANQPAQPTRRPVAAVAR